MAGRGEGDACRACARFVLFKQGVITAHESHFAGGKHAFISMANTLAAEGFDVHVVSIASRGKVLVHAGMLGLLPLLSFAKAGVVTWREQNMHHHVILDDEISKLSGRSSSCSCSPSSLPALAAVVSSYIRGLTQPGTPTQNVRTSAPVYDTTFSETIVPGIQQQRPALPVIHDSDAPSRCRGDISRNLGAPPHSRADSLSLSGTWLVVDADESQKLLQGPDPDGETLREPPPPPRQQQQEQPQQQQPQLTDISGGGQGGNSSNIALVSAVCDDMVDTTRVAITLFEAVVAAVPTGRCLALVQNVHFLPMGPSGTGPRRPELLSAWSRLGAVLAVSEFIAGYVRQNWPAAVRSGVAEAEAVLPPPPVRVVPLATWGVFGRPPFPDLAAVARPLLQAWRGAVAAAPPPLPLPQTSASAPDLVPVPPSAVPSAAPEVSGEVGSASTACTMTGSSQVEPKVMSVGDHHNGDVGQTRNAPAVAAAPPPPSQPQSAPVVVDVAVLKLTPEKGASILAALARRLEGRVRFRVVTGDPAAAATLAPLTARGVVEVWEPQPDVSRVLSDCVAVLAPSLWLEAWGMVVTEALLRGLPAVVSDLGGLPEAGMGLCPAVRVDPIRIPPDADGVPDWSARTYPKQDIDAWERALMALLLDRLNDGGDGRVTAAAAAPPPLETAELGSLAAMAGSDVSGVWEQLSSAGRAAALEHVSRRREFLTQWLDWLAELPGAGTEP